MRTTINSLLLTGLLTMVFLAPAPAVETSMATDRWEFDVFLDDKKIGKHLFEVTNIDGVQKVRSQANFKYTVLYVPVYRYEHSNSERWSENCLLGLEAKTNANGKKIRVSGQKSGSGFTVRTDDSPVDLPECVMTFAYWNPLFLEQTRLLNPQTGEFLDISVEEVAKELIEIRGLPVSATRFRLTASELEVSLWYSSDNRWLALESVAKGGRIIRYELS